MPFQISLEPGGQRFTADDDQTILEAALAAGLVLPYGCRDGACGACKGKVVSGEVELGPVSAGALSDAVEQYRKSVELGPAFIDLRYRLARLLLDSGNPLAAREELEKVLQARPGFVEAQGSLGLAHYLGGDASEARRIWKDALERQPENTRIEAYLAMMDRAKE